MKHDFSDGGGGVRDVCWFEDNVQRNISAMYKRTKGFLKKLNERRYRTKLQIYVIHTRFDFISVMIRGSFTDCILACDSHMY